MVSTIYNEIIERLRKAELNLIQLEGREGSKIFEEGRIAELKYLKNFIEISFEKEDYIENEDDI